ncbi:MAG: hypothetical protein QOJ88_1145 [Pyrinomonadaceae bacterium]|nr:hypothetical protein [Pyrinomonadaceae bacterium]
MKRLVVLPLVLVLFALVLMAWDFTVPASANKQGSSGKSLVPAQTQTVLKAGDQVFPAQPALRYEGDELDDAQDPDQPAKIGAHIERDDYLRMRGEYVERLRGIEPGKPFDVQQRVRAVAEMQRQEAAIRSASKSTTLSPMGAFPNWTAIGPSPLPNGQSVTGTSVPVSGRATAVATDTVNNVIYLGAAQGGVWRSADGGVTWTPIFDGAASLSIGALAVAPSQPTTLYVGTGETNNCVDCYFGVGLYRIDNANSATPTIVGPINPNFTFTPSGGGGPLTTTVFGNVGISKILVHPTDPATIFVSTKTGTAGATEANFNNWPTQFIPPFAVLGVWRSTNATAAAGTVAFTKLAVPTAASASVDTPATGNRAITDMIMEPGVPDNIIVYAFGANVVNDGGAWRTTTATTTGTFTQVRQSGSTRWTFAIHKVGAAVTVYAATTEGFTNIGCNSATTRFGTLRRSIDGGATFANVLAGGAGTAGIIQGAAGFCDPQCSYDITVAVDPNNVNNIYLGGSAPGYTPCSHAVARSTDGIAFAADETAVHADTHNIVADQTGTNIYDANDGGLWKRAIGVAVNTPWTDINNAPLNTLQFQSIAVHPTDQNFTIGGTQDNGTEWQSSVSGTWVNAEGGDGGYSLIDSNSAGTAVTQYHTFFCASNSQIIFDRATSTVCNGIKDSWPTRGPFTANGTTVFANDPTPAPCDGQAFYIGNNGIQLYDNVLFYPPMALGPGNPNTFYFGTDRLYRSTDKGDSMTIVSQSPILPTGTRVPITGGAAQSVGTIVTAIGISPQNDNVRMVGFQNGKVWATSTGSSTLVDISPTLPAHPVTGQSQYVGHVVINPTNPDVAYISLAYFTPAGQGIYKITNLQAASGAAPVAPVWTASSTGIPSIPINALVIDPAKPNRVFAGTDMGVYISENAGVSWSPFGQGLPKVAVFDMAIQPTSRTLRVATHGRGMWEIALQAPTAAPAAISGKVTTTNGTPLAGVTMNLSGARTAKTITDSQGNYRFSNVDTDSFYTVTPALVNYHFGPANSSFSLVGNKTDAVFTATRDAVIVGNVIDAPDYFVRQHYLDFLGREPDESGFNFWSDQISSCGSDSGCVERRTINVSAAYFLSIEFQETGGLVDALYRASFGRAPRYAEFMPEVGTIAHDVVVGRADWSQQLDANKQAFLAAWVQRPDFQTAYGGLTSAGYVDALLGHTRVSFSQSERNALVNSLNEGTLTRTAVLKQIAEDERFVKAKRNEAFVMMEYFGYLRRDPDQSGYDFWLRKLNDFGGNFEQAEMVKAFINSGEYRSRFVQ